MAAEQDDASLKEFDHDAMVELFSDYYEDRLDTVSRSKVERRLASNREYEQAYRDFEKTMQVLSGMLKMSAPPDFDKKIERTIYNRSGGRFFGKRAFGDRIPYELLAIIAMAVATSVYWMGRSNVTGGHRLEKERPQNIHEGAREVMPRL